MASIKQALPGSPFQFRNARQHLLPPFEDVKIAKYKWCPQSSNKNVGFLRYILTYYYSCCTYSPIYRSAANMFEGRVTARLCPKTEYTQHVISETERPCLEFEYGMYTYEHIMSVAFSIIQ